jgi:AcrR family transcriptional regulator
MNKGAQTRATILSQAIAVAGVHGLDGMSIGRLAEVTGMSKSGLFGHFGSKEALQRAVLDTAGEEHAQQVLVPALLEYRSEDRLRALFRHWMDWLGSDARPGGCPLISAATELADRPGDLRDFLVEQQQGWIGQIRRLCQQAVTEGGFRNDLDVRQFVSEFHGIGLEFHYAHRFLADDRALNHANATFEKLMNSAKSAREDRGPEPGNP